MNTVIILGAGHNGLSAAFYLAKAGLKPIVFERRDIVGGGAVTHELHPGFRVPLLAHHTPLREAVAREMNLPSHGLEFLAPRAQVFSPGTDGRALILHNDMRASVEAIRAFSAKDADAYADFRASVGEVSSLLGWLLSNAPPRIDKTATADLLTLLRTGRRFRALGRENGYRLLRWISMSAADLVREWFTSEPLGASIAARGAWGGMLGPRSAGSALALLIDEATTSLAPHPAARVRGGPGALTRAMAAAAREAGADIRTGLQVEQIGVRDARVTGVIVNGSEIPARAVLSSADPKSTFLQLVDPVNLTPDFMAKIRSYRSFGTLAKVNLALTRLPSFTCNGATPDALSGRIHVGPEIDYVERAFDHAKYGRFSSQPWLDITIPSLLEPELAPAGAHVMSIYVHYAPFNLRETTWDKAGAGLLEATLETLERFAPGIESLVIATQVITPADLAHEYGFAGGHIFHGELALDQLFMMRPLLGHAQYASPIRGLYLCGAGTHPGGFFTGENGRLAAGAVIHDLAHGRRSSRDEAL
jgi:phytoene dehydrogenase-like protein